MQQQGLLLRAIHGDALLWQAFWLLFVPTLLVLYVLYVSILSSVLVLSSPRAFTSFVLTFATFSFLVSSGAALVVWRCSRNVSRPIWRYLALLAVGAYVIWYGQRVLSLWLFMLAR